MDCGEIGRGAYGTVNKMLHKESNTCMAVKVCKMSEILKVIFWRLHVLCGALSSNGKEYSGSDAAQSSIKT